MPPIPFQQLSDEPLYCEAVHNKDDDGFYSGSEDDHYEAPLHRRLHIEKKAIEFLSGNVPFLLSAALRGPFDRKQWNNPWRSTRAEAQEESSNAQPARPGQTAAPEEDLPDTQGTCLYPLPSPEITNPPSARKNPYMEEQDYSRIKNWRAAVKSTSVSKDPFWQSQQDIIDDPSARKRSADPTWLHKHDRKKRGPVNPKSSTPDDSPSRVAAQTKGSQTRQPHASQLVAHFLRGSSPPEDELATNRLTMSPCSNIIVADKSNGISSALRPGLTTPRRVTRLRQAADTSEDELSMPATTPASGVRSSTMVPASPTRDRSPSRRKRPIISKSRAPSGRQSSRIGKSKKAQFSQSSASQRSDLGAVTAHTHTMAHMAEAALERMDGSPGNLFKQPRPFQDQAGAEVAATTNLIIVSQALAELPSTQQDNSFLFRKRPRSPPRKMECESTNGIPPNAAGLSPSSLQLCVTTTDEQGDNFPPKEGPVVPVVTGPTAMAEKDTRMGQKVPYVPVEESRGQIFTSAMDEASPSGHNLISLRAQLTDNTTVCEIKAGNEFPAKLEPGAVDDVPENVELGASNKQEAIEEPRTLLQVDGCSQSNSEWSTRIDTQLDRTPGPASEEDATKKKPDTPVIEDGIDVLSDPEWSTMVNTQDITPPVPDLEAAADPEATVTTISPPDPDLQIGSEQITHANIEAFPPASPEEGVMANEIARPASVTISSGDRTRNAPENTTSTNDSQDSKPSQASVGSIIDAYAEISFLSADLGSSTAGMPEAKLMEAGAEADAPTSPCSLPNQIVAAPVDESGVNSDSIAGGQPQRLQASEQDPVATKYQSGHACGSSADEVVCVKKRDVAGFLHLAAQTPGEVRENARCAGSSGLLDEPTASPVVTQLQSPWKGEVAMSLQMPPQAAGNGISLGCRLSGLDEAAAPAQSPWNKKADSASHLFVPPMTCTTSIGNTTDLGKLAGKALTMFQSPMSPWAPQTPAAPASPAAGFEMSIRALSDFMSPSPVKKRASSNGSTLRCSSAGSGILFKTMGQQKPARRVHFARLPGEQESFITACVSDERDAIYDEEDVSYFDLSGRKTGTVRVPKQTMRAASPPPMETSSVEVGGLHDHDQKFAKHFAAISKRKKSQRKSLRLLPSESQQIPSASQEVGAMAEAFIQASQTRKKGLDLAAEKRTEAECRHEYEETAPVPMAMAIYEDQENVEPVDDVSAVLDNLDKFFDDTWCIELGSNDQLMDGRQSKQDKQNAAGQEGQRKGEDPLFSLEANVWAD